MKKAPTLSKITLANEDELFTCNVDQGLFEKKYPQLYETYKDQLASMERWEVEELLPNNDSIEDIVLKEKAVLLHLSNKEIVTIYNTELIDFNGLESNGFTVYSKWGFVYFLISIVGGQAGSLGIWSLAERRWIFTHRDDGFCVEAIIFIPKAKCFVGFSLWYQYANPGVGEFFFFIDADRRYSQLKLEEAGEFNWTSISTDLQEAFVNQDDAYIGYDQSQSAIYKIMGSDSVAYRLDDMQIRALQSRGTSQN